MRRGSDTTNKGRSYSNDYYCYVIVNAVNFLHPRLWQRLARNLRHGFVILFLRLFISSIAELVHSPMLCTRNKVGVGGHPRWRNGSRA